MNNVHVKILLEKFEFDGVGIILKGSPQYPDFDGWMVRPDAPRGFYAVQPRHFQIY